jgi:hypothetical protein
VRTKKLLSNLPACRRHRTAHIRGFPRPCEPASARHMRHASGASVPRACRVYARRWLPISSRQLRRQRDMQCAILCQAGHLLSILGQQVREEEHTAWLQRQAGAWRDVAALSWALGLRGRARSCFKCWCAASSHRPLTGSCSCRRAGRAGAAARYSTRSGFRFSLHDVAANFSLSTM